VASKKDKQSEKKDTKAEKRAEAERKSAKKAAHKAQKKAKEAARELAHKAKKKARKAKDAPKRGVSASAGGSTKGPAITTPVAATRPVSTLSPNDSWTVTALRARARELGIANYSRLDKVALLERLTSL